MKTNLIKQIKTKKEKPFPKLMKRKPLYSKYYVFVYFHRPDCGVLLYSENPNYEVENTVFQWCIDDSFEDCEETHIAFNIEE